MHHSNWRPKRAFGSWFSPKRLVCNFIGGFADLYWMTQNWNDAFEQLENYLAHAQQKCSAHKKTLASKDDWSYIYREQTETEKRLGITEGPTDAIQNVVTAEYIAETLLVSNA